MADSIRDLMTKDPRTVDAGDSIQDAARIMREDDVGAVIVNDGDSLAGIVTDRDIAVRAVADGKDLSAQVSEVCSKSATTLGPDDSVDDAVRVMREEKIRRVPVVEDGRAVGIVSLGDLAEARDPDEALAEISAAAPNN